MGNWERHVSVSGEGLCGSEKGQDRPWSDHRYAPRRLGQPERGALLPQEEPWGGTFSQAKSLLRSVQQLVFSVWSFFFMFALEMILFIIDTLPALTLHLCLRKCIRLYTKPHLSNFKVAFFKLSLSGNPAINYPVCCSCCLNISPMGL